MSEGDRPGAGGGTPETDRAARKPMPGGRRCAFLVAAEPHHLVADDDLARAPLRSLGWTVESVPWDRPTDWGRYDAVVVRSTWDYHRDPRTFEDALARIHASGTPLANPLPVIRWNLHKTYLLDLERAGVPIVPTRVVDRLRPGEIDALREALDADELVVKPVVGANGNDVLRIGTGPDAARAAEAAFRERPALIQPFLPTVLSDGEVSLVFLAGAPSHGLRKRPTDGEFRTQEERGARLTAFRPDRGLLQLARHAVEAAGSPTLYARIDLIRDPAGSWRLVELELVEPSLYLRMDPDAAGRFARAIAGWASGAGAGPASG